MNSSEPDAVASPLDPGPVPSSPDHGPADAGVGDAMVIGKPVRDAGTTDAPVALDARPIDAPVRVDARPIDAPVRVDARPIDAPVRVDARPIDARVDARPIDARVDARPIDAPVHVDARPIDAPVVFDAPPIDATPVPDAGVIVSGAIDAGGSTTPGYHVGPGQQYANIGDVPWYALQPGDTVYIHYRTTPYHEKFLISGRGTPTQWIRVLGVPGPGGELPVISGDGATTSTNMHYHWQDASGSSAIQWGGIIQVAVRADATNDPAPIPGYIEIANLQVQDATPDYTFTAENGQTSPYEPFAACIYAKSAQHILVRNNVLTNCGLGFYNWIGDGSIDKWWAALEIDTVLRGNYFYNNGVVGSYTEHQVYVESDGSIIEDNRFGPQRAGALGSQIKDRSAGSVIRYNYIEQSPQGWDLDLVEPQESAPALVPKPTYKQAFVYGNIFVNRGVRNPNIVHWNEDHQVGDGRATLTDGKLYFYDNTVVVIANASDLAAFNIINATWGGYDCPAGTLPGTIDVRNNLFVVAPRTAGSAIPQLRFGYCGQENFDFGVNWVSPGYTVHGAIVTGIASLLSPAGNDPGFVDAASNDFRLVAGSSATGIGANLDPAVTSNTLGFDLTPILQYAPDETVVPRSLSGAGSDVGAFER